MLEVYHMLDNKRTCKHDESKALQKIIAKKRAFTDLNHFDRAVNDRSNEGLFTISYAKIEL